MFRRFDGTWQDMGEVRRYDGSNWIGADFVRRWDGGAWVDAWVSYVAIGVTVAPAFYQDETANNTGPYTPSFTATVTNGDGGHTFAWGVTGTGLSIISGQGTATAQIEIANGANLTRTGTLTVTVDDGTSSDVANVSIDHIYANI